MSGPEFTIKPFTANYQQKARELILKGLGEHWGWIDEHINSDLVNISDSYSSGSFILGFLGDLLIATGALIPETKNVSRIVRMSVAAEFRRHGYGRQILEHLLSVAQNKSIRKIVLETTETWDEVIAFYSAFGFKIDRYSDGDVHMFKELNFQAKQ